MWQFQTTQLSLPQLTRLTSLFAIMCKVTHLPASFRWCFHKGLDGVVSCWTQVTSYCLGYESARTQTGYSLPLQRGELPLSHEVSHSSTSTVSCSSASLTGLFRPVQMDIMCLLPRTREVIERMFDEDTLVAISQMFNCLKLVQSGFASLMWSGLG